MRPERWHKIERLFHAALEREPADRPAFLANSCGGDASLYNEVNSLLSSFDQSDSFFDAAASSLAAQMFGDKVGSCQILSVLGSGGMGT